MITVMHTALAARAVGDFRQHLTALGRAKSTVELRTHYVGQFLAESGVSPWAACATDVEHWLVSHPEWSVQTRRIVLLSVRQFYGWAVDAGHIAASPVERLDIPRQPRYVAHPIPDEVLADALARASGDVWWILRILATTGLRRSECAALTSSQVQGRWLTVRGKGGRERRLPVPEDVAAFIVSRHGRVFTGPQGGALSPITLATWVRRVTRGYGPHSLRHRYATRIYAATGDVLAVQQLLGHASLATTQTYLGLGEDRLIAAAAAAA